MSEDNTTTPKTYHCEYNEVSATTHRLYLFVIGPILVLGLFLNAANILVLRRTKSSSNAFFMLQFLALSDIFYLLISLLYFPVRRLIGEARYGDEVYKRIDWDICTDILIVIDPLYHMFLVARNWMVVVITVERLLNILAPFWARTAITRFRLKIVIGLVFLIAVTLHMPKWMTWTLEYGINECSGEDAMFIRVPNNMVRSDHYIYIVMTVTAPMCAIYVANVMLVLSLRRSFLERAKMGSESKEGVSQQRQAVVIVLAMSMVFTVFETPACVDRFIYFAIGSESALTYLLRRGALILNVTDSTVNFFAYCASSRPFRNSLFSLLGRRSDSTDDNVNTRTSQVSDG